MKKSESAGSEMTWSGWLQALQSCNERLAKALDELDWDTAQSEVTTRDHLLRTSAPVLMRLKQAEEQGEAAGDLDQVKQVLQEVQETGRAFIEALTHRRQELDQRIKAMRQGRATVNLYRPAKSQAPPRFLDRKG